MFSMTRKATLGLFAAATVTAMAAPASATFSYKWDDCDPKPKDECIVLATASSDYDPYCTGDSYKNPYFWGISFLEGCKDASITSVTFDLRAGSDGNAYFDLAGSNSYGPVIGSKSGLKSSDITFVNTTDSPTLTINFKEGSFGVGDKLYFGADTDNLGNDKAYDVGKKGVGFTVTFANGESVSSTFYKYDYNTSKAKVTSDNCCGTGIPTPAAAGMGLVLLGSAAVRRRRKA